MRRTNIVLIILVLISLTLSSQAFGKEVTKTVEVRLQHIENQLEKMHPPMKRLNAPLSQLENLKQDLSELKEVVNLTSTLILCAILGIGIFVSIGIPIGVVIAWRYRNTILNKVDKLTLLHENDSASLNAHPHTPQGPVISSR